MKVPDPRLIIPFVLLFIILYFSPLLIFNTRIDTSIQSSSDAETRIFIGILTMPDKYETRHLLRLVYGIQSPIGAHIDVRFILCTLTTDDQRILVSLEIMKYKDIIILDCAENMNQGKTYTFFSSLPRLFSSKSIYPPYHYVMKADDDMYIRLQYFVDSLKSLPREDAFYGFELPSSYTGMEDMKFMLGACYLVSWDIVEWIGVSDIPKNNLTGNEDNIFGLWLYYGNRGRNRYDMRDKIYDFPGSNEWFTHELWPGTVAVHQLKTQDARQMD